MHLLTTSTKLYLHSYIQSKHKSNAHPIHKYQQTTIFEPILEMKIMFLLIAVCPVITKHHVNM
ncbi:hypothetical protein Hanom_Chr16g01415641 [Helianthus anomalus]